MAVIVSPQGWTGSWSGVSGTTGTFTGSGSYAGRTFSVYTPSASNGSCYLPYAFDNNTTYGLGTIWQASGITYFTITYNDVVKVESYQLWNGLYSGPYTCITGWELYGSNDGSNYTLVHNVPINSYYASSGGASFTVTSPNYYKYYKFVVLSSWNGSWSTVTELQLWGTFGQSYVHNDSDLTTAMTSNTTPSPYVVSASTEYHPTNYPAWKAFNHVNNAELNQWIAQSTITTGWLKYYFGGEYKIVTSYSMFSYTDAYKTYLPKNWTFQGSNDDSSWTTLDTRSNIVWEGFQTQTFSFSNSTGYKYYRINVTANGGAPQGLVIWELEMFGSSIQTYSHNASDLTATQTSDTSPRQLLSSGTYSGYPMYNAFNHTNTALWISSTGVPVWLGVDLGNAYVLTGCAISIPTNYQAYAPTTFTIQGANFSNFTGAVTLSSQSGLTWYSNEMKTFSWSNSTAYRYFRVYVTACGGSYCYIGQIEIFGSFGHIVYAPNINDVTTNQTDDLNPLQLLASNSHVSYPVNKSFRTTSNSGWQSATGAPVWVGIDLGKSYVLTSCTISAFPATGYEVYAPTTFTIQASNRLDFVNYVTLSSQSGLTWGFNEMKTFSWSNTVAYRYFRVYVTACGGSHCSIGQIEIFGNVFVPNKLNAIPHNKSIYSSNNTELIDITTRSRIGNYYNSIGGI